MLNIFCLFYDLNSTMEIYLFWVDTLFVLLKQSVFSECLFIQSLYNIQTFLIGWFGDINLYFMAKLSRYICTSSCWLWGYILMGFCLKNQVMGIISC